MYEEPLGLSTLFVFNSQQAWQVKILTLDKARVDSCKFLREQAKTYLRALWLRENRKFSRGLFFCTLKNKIAGELYGKKA